MESQLYVQYSHRLEGHYPSDSIDTEFYKSLPGVRENYRDPESGEPDSPIPSMDQILIVVGTTKLSSADIASAIKSWLSHNRTKIAISDPLGRQTIQFEGPNLVKSAEAIKEMIDTLVGEDISEVTLRATYID